MRRWRFPSLSLHGIEGAFYGQGAKTVIPAKVIGKFSIRTVPNQDPEHITELVVKYLNEQWATLPTKNKMVAKCLQAGRSWLSDINHYNYGNFLDCGTHKKGFFLFILKTDNFSGRYPGPRGRLWRQARLDSRRW